jgi:hypothetical protein
MIPSEPNAGVTCLLVRVLDIMDPVGWLVVHLSFEVITGSEE